ncbi:hypothetical protein [Brevundimonas sp.]
MAFDQVRAEIRNSRAGRVRVELWVNALLNDDDEGMLPDADPSNVISLCRARLELTRLLVSVIDDRHRTWKRYPVLAALAKFHGWEPEALGLAYLRHLRRDLEVASAPRTGPNPSGGSVVALYTAEGRSEGP